MILSCDRKMLEAVADFQLTKAILERRKVVRTFRDQRGDDRCFLDYYSIWEFLVSSPSMPKFSAEEGMRHCTLFYENCRAITPDIIPFGANSDLRRSDANLPRMSHGELVGELMMVQITIMRHRDIEIITGRKRDVSDDRRLCDTILPERDLGDYTLPERGRFLVSIDGKSGCPAFWLSHASCGSNCNLHGWGPCKP